MLDTDPNADPATRLGELSTLFGAAVEPNRVSRLLGDNPEPDAAEQWTLENTGQFVGGIGNMIGEVAVIRHIIRLTTDRPYEYVSSILLTTTLEHAELKREQIHAFGRDDQLPRSVGSMNAILEPVGLS